MDKKITDIAKKTSWRQSFRIFFLETKTITTVAIVATLVTIALDYTKFRFRGLISNVCYSVIAAYIFYLIQIYFPERKKNRLLAIRIRGYILGKIIDNLWFITTTLDKNTRESLSEDYTDIIIETATEAYNNLFKCTDDFAQTIDNSILDVVVALTEDQFLYGLYFLRHYLDDNNTNREAIYDLYEDCGDDFKILKNKLSELVKSLPQYGQELSNDLKKK